MAALLILVIVAALLALGYAAFNFIGVKKKADEGTDQYVRRSRKLSELELTHLLLMEYKIIGIVVVIIAIIFAAIFQSSMENSARSHQYVSSSGCDECISRMGRNEDCNLCKMSEYLIQQERLRISVQHSR